MSPCSLWFFDRTPSVENRSFLLDSTISEEIVCRIFLTSGVEIPCEKFLSFVKTGRVAVFYIFVRRSGWKSVGETHATLLCAVAFLMIYTDTQPVPNS
jgi:hypothetical protein